MGAARADASLAALTFRAAGDELRTRVVVIFDREPEVSTLLLAHPHRLVIDLPRATFGFDKKSLEPRGLITHVRYGLVGDNRSRMILTLRGPFKLEGVRVVKNENTPGYRLMADIVATSDREFAAALDAQKPSPGTARAERKGDRVGANPEPSPPHVFTVMIDPGHGGIDAGAESLHGVKEKDVTLAFAREFRDVLTKSGDMRVLMTREDDTFLRLAERVRIARQHEADLFISIHADTINQHDIRGATVYTLSDKASDAMARAMAERENKSDAAAGLTHEEPPEVSDILADLTRRETHAFSLSFAGKVVNALQDQTSLINNPHRFAGFQVLRAPDVPSVLVEIGYLSNAEDEKLMTDPAWRARVAAGLAEAVKAFAALKSRQAVTKSGE
ncbi:N-acetylmuramoyl-L-alanine amidase [Brucella sp. IR073]|uniref:N-acetylmuramoyl-L-alanine amidase n=1 Tax=unclassified Brucella TaxID=2632610 RepID=UPI003B985C00